MLIFSVVLIAGFVILFMPRKERLNVAASDLEADVPAQIQLGYLLVLIGGFGFLLQFWGLPEVFLLAVIISGAGTVYGYLKPKASYYFVIYSKSYFPIFLVVFLFKSFLFEPFQIPSSSMRPNLTVGDFILVNKFTYGIRVPILNNVFIPVSKVQRGDVVVFKFPVDTSVYFVKRIVAVGGDEIEYRNKRLFVNDVEIKQQPIGNYSYRSDDSSAISDVRLLEEKDSSENRKILIDDASPTYYPDQVMRFEGIENCRFWLNSFSCKVPEGKYFAMGDNRDNSSDSRYWGFVDDNLLVGKAFVILLNFRLSYLTEPSQLLEGFKRLGTSID